MFKTKADANTEVTGAIANDLIPNWANHRMSIVTTGKTTITRARVGGPGTIVAYQRNKAGGVWPIGEKPAYHGYGGAGQKPLFYPDADWDAWAAPLTAPQKIALTATPLTTDATGALPNVHVRILASDNPVAKGWIIQSVYPKS